MTLKTSNYGPESFGPGGSIIDTNLWFNVQNDFVSTSDYTKLWKLRTTLWQNYNTITMEAECPQYLDPLTYDTNAQMSIVISSWDNNDKRSDFEFNNT